MKLTREQVHHLLKQQSFSNSGYGQLAINVGLGKYEYCGWSDVKDYVEALESKCVTLAMLVADKIVSGELK